MKRTLLAALSVLALVASVGASPVLACGAKAGEMASCPMKMKGVERTATNLDNGVKIVFAAKDAEQVKTIQAALANEAKHDGCKDCPMHAEGVQRDAQNTPDGVVLTLTSDNVEQVQTLQKFGASGCKGGCGKKADGGCPHAAKESADRT